MIIRIIIAAVTICFLSSCDSMESNKTSLAALGIHTMHIEAEGISEVKIYRHFNGQKEECLVTELVEGKTTIRIQLGLPNNKMRVAIGNSQSAIASTYEDDIITNHAFTFTASPINKAGEYILMQTNDDKLSEQNKIILLAQ